MDIPDLLRSLEEKLLDNSVRKNPEIVSEMLAGEFQEFGSSGRVFDKQQVIALLQSEPTINLFMQDFRAQLLSNEIALVTYRSSKAEARNRPTRALRSSIWVNRGGQWRILFHQGTTIS